MTPARGGAGKFPAHEAQSNQSESNFSSHKVLPQSIQVSGGKSVSAHLVSKLRFARKQRRTVNAERHTVNAFTAHSQALGSRWNSGSGWNWGSGWNRGSGWNSGSHRGLD